MSTSNPSSSWGKIQTVGVVRPFWGAEWAAARTRERVCGIPAPTAGLSAETAGPSEGAAPPSGQIEISRCLWAFWDVRALALRLYMYLAFAGRPPWRSRVAEWGPAVRGRYGGPGLFRAQIPLNPSNGLRASSVVRASVYASATQHD